MDIQVLIKLNGSLSLSTMHNGYRVQRAYQGYTIPEAKKHFKQYIKGLE